ncbi:MAG: hypothetical protein GWO07_14895 [Candidatus Dadabacteria bacterium]|nr:hypothetical protein [Candidatus Dadabacteria bacterium]NIS09999.1 hypothetical protein [Candidatus Dadabacteria bacterium]NIY22970.1 hypothetical protein [Candidatus Dadabacteria bacterium]
MLVTNSLKYSCPNGKSGNILVNMTLVEDNEYRLAISNDGISLPQNIYMPSLKSLGLKLALRLSEQLDGAFNIDVLK